MRGSAAVEYMTNDVVWTNQASSAAGVAKRCPSVPCKGLVVLRKPDEGSSRPIRESGLCSGLNVDFGQCDDLGRFAERVGWRIRGRLLGTS